MLMWWPLYAYAVVFLLLGLWCACEKEKGRR